MRLAQLRISNFQSFGPAATDINLESMTFLLGPNGSGKTTVLQALVRLFGFDHALRRLRRTDFHVAPEDLTKGSTQSRTLWIEAQFEFPELKNTDGRYAAVPVHFAHMQLETADGLPRVRFRLLANMDEEGEIEESLVYIIQTNAQGEPTKTVPVPKLGRNAIQVHYLPARRDPNDHISGAATSLMGRMLRAADWQSERDSVVKLTQQISDALAGNAAIASIGDRLAAQWKDLHRGSYYSKPSLSFQRNEIDNLLRHLTVTFTPGHGEHLVDFSRLSDGQQSLLYLSLVLAAHTIGCDLLTGNLQAFDVNKLRPAVFTLVAMEEPENSLSPHYLGRVIKALNTFADHSGAQAIIATHAPALLKRVPPERILYLRLDGNRHTQIATIIMPDKADEAYKFVREAVQAFPELYFSRLVILGEGDSEEILLARLLDAYGLGADETSISVVPLGGRHVNHFWRLMQGLGIPHVTLLDLDLARYQGGWGRIKYAAQQLLNYSSPEIKLTPELVAKIPKWNGNDPVFSSELGKKWLHLLERHSVFFSLPLDLDMTMISTFADAYGVDDTNLAEPDEDTVVAVLGKSHGNVDQYKGDVRKYFHEYHRCFNLHSKPVAHLDALAQLDNAELIKKLPMVYKRLLDQVKLKLRDLPE